MPDNPLVRMIAMMIGVFAPLVISYWFVFVLAGLGGGGVLFFFVLTMIGWVAAIGAYRASYPSTEKADSD